MRRTLPTLSFASVCVALLALFAANATAQPGFSATATVVSKSADDVDALRQQIVALEKRVAELEKEKLEDVDVKDDAEEQAAKKLEQRLANLEKNQAAAKAASAGTNDRGADDKPLTVTAPFTVVDSDGKPLLRVAEEQDGFSRGVYVYNGDAKVVAHMGAQSGGPGRVYVSDGDRPRAIMAVQSDGGRLVLGATGSDKGVRIDPQALRILVNDTTSVAFFGTTDGATGYMELGNSAGQKLVGARINSSGLGILETGPLDGGAAVSILGGRPASSLIGKKN